MKKKIMVFLMCVMMVISLIGCGGSAGGSSSTSSSSGNDTLTNVLSNGKLRVGMAMTPPMATRDESGEVYGYEAETAQALADALGVELEIVEITGAERIPALETGKVDCVISTLTRNVSRAQKVAFSDPYFTCPCKLITTKGSSLTADSTLEELSGTTVGAVKNTTTSEQLGALTEEYNFTLFQAESVAELQTALDNGQIESYACDGSNVDYLVLENPDKYQSGPVTSAPYFNCIGVRLDDTIWLNYVNTFIAEKNKDSFFSDLYVKYFGVECEYPLTPVY